MKIITPQYYAKIDPNSIDEIPHCLLKYLKESQKNAYDILINSNDSLKYQH